MKKNPTFYCRDFHSGMSRKQMDTAAMGLVMTKRKSEERGPLWNESWKSLDLEPQKSEVCWYCCYPYPDGMKAIGLPEKFYRLPATDLRPRLDERQNERRQWLVSGSFCSPFCLRAYVHRTQMSDQHRERYLYHIRLYLKDIYGYTQKEQYLWKEDGRELSLPFYALSKFGGPLSYDEYRSLDCPREMVVDSLPPIYTPRQIVINVPSFPQPKVDFSVAGEKFVWTPPPKTSKKPSNVFKRKKDQRVPSLLPVRKGIVTGMMYPSVLDALKN